MSNVQFPYPRQTPPATPKFPSARSSSTFRPRDARQIVVYVAGGFTIFLFLLWLVGGSSSSSSSSSMSALPPGTPGAVIVTTFDPSMSKTFKESIMANRRDYAARHGYATFFPNTTDYNLMAGVPKSWSTVPALRHAMARFPDTPWLFYLTSHALIMEPHEGLDKKLLEPRTLESLMIADKPVVPPDSVIKTFPNLRGDKIDIILTQDIEGLASGSLLIRTGDWAKYFLDAWFDPLYRSYNFQKAEIHALEHIVQWHGTVLAKMALVPQRLINSYMKDKTRLSNTEGVYQEGDFIANFEGCARDKKRQCEAEMEPMLSRWRELRDQEQI